jgi:hypothetical protein
MLAVHLTFHESRLRRQWSAYYHDSCFFYLKLLGVIASGGSPQEGCFVIDLWQRWQKNDEGRHRLDPWRAP